MIFKKTNIFSTFQEYKNTLNDEVKTIAPRGGSSVVASKNGDKIFLLGKVIDIGGNSLLTCFSNRNRVLFQELVTRGRSCF